MTNSNLKRTRSSMTTGGSFSQGDILAVWNKGKIVAGNDPVVWRKDVCGAWIKFSEYGNVGSQYGWEIDHVMPVSVGGSDNLMNLQPLQWENNRHKSDSVNAPYCKVTANNTQNQTS